MQKKQAMCKLAVHCEQCTTTACRAAMSAELRRARACAFDVCMTQIYALLNELGMAQNTKQGGNKTLPQIGVSHRELLKEELAKWTLRAQTCSTLHSDRTGLAAALAESLIAVTARLRNAIERGNKSCQELHCESERVDLLLEGIKICMLQR